MPRDDYNDDELGFVVGSVVPSDGVSMTEEDEAKLRKELRRKEQNKQPFGFCLERADQD